MIELSGHDSRALANEILRVASAKGIALTLMQLLKVEYFAHGWSLAILNKPLSKHQAQAWQYGPVFPPVYKILSDSGAGVINKRIIDKATGVEFSEEYDDAEQKLIETTVEGYARETAFKLSGMTHEKDSPWDRTRNEKGLYQPIPNEWIKEYFLAIRSS